MIKSIGLRNVLAFRDMAVATDGLTLLSGANSAGKSSILHVLALLKQSLDARTLPESLLLNGDLVELGTGSDVLHNEPLELEGKDQFALGIELKLDGAALGWVASYDPEADVLLLQECPEEPLVSSLFSHGFQYLVADRVGPAVTYPKSHEAVTVRGSLGRQGEHAANFLRVHGEEQITCIAAAHPHAVSDRLLDQVNAWLADISPGTEIDAVDVEGTDFVRLRFMRLGPEVRTKPQRATNVGFGLTYALPLVLACLTASPGALILIENPEAHLHPRAQAMLGRLCARAAAGGAQLFVETHSDHVLNAVRLAVKRGEIGRQQVALNFFDREDRVLQPRLVRMEIGDDGMIDQWPPGFFDQWDHAVEELLD
jgi:predicted ATPase